MVSDLRPVCRTASLAALVAPRSNVSTNTPQTGPRHPKVVLASSHHRLRIIFWERSDLKWIPAGLCMIHGSVIVKTYYLSLPLKSRGDNLVVDIISCVYVKWSIFTLYVFLSEWPVWSTMRWNKRMNWCSTRWPVRINSELEPVTFLTAQARHRCSNRLALGLKTNILECSCPWWWKTHILIRLYQLIIWISK